jgi:hypothetical protein
LYLPYAKLTSYSTGLMQISNDAKLIMADGAYKDIRGTDPRHSEWFCWMWAWPSPMWQCSTSTTLPASQSRTTAGNIK